MATIDAHRRSSGFRVWALAALAALIVIWAIVIARGSADTDMTAAPEPPSAPASASGPAGTVGATLPPPAVAALMTFVHAPGGSEVGVNHDYAADGIRRLSDALRAVVNQSGRSAAIDAQLAALQQNADRIQSDPIASTHAARVHEVFSSAAELMSSIQQQRWPSDADLSTEIRKVTTAASAIDPRRPLLEQTSAVKTFLSDASETLRTMATRG